MKEIGFPKNQSLKNNENDLEVVVVINYPIINNVDVDAGDDSKMVKIIKLNVLKVTGLPF